MRRACGIVAVLVLGLAVPARASITSPAHDEVVSGVAPITEDVGGPASCIGADTRIEVTDEHGIVVASRTKGAGGALTLEWDTRGSRAAEYRISSFGRSEMIAGDKGPLCKPSDWYVIDTAKVRVDNPSSVTGKLPDKALFGDSIEVSATLRGPGGLVLSGRTLAFALDGGRSVSALTDEVGEARAVMPVDAPPGATTLRATFAGDTAYRSSVIATPFTVAARDAALRYTGPARAAIGDTVRLSAQLVDLPSGASRPDTPVKFAFVSCPSSCGSGPWRVTTDGAGEAAVVVDLEGFEVGGYVLSLEAAADGGHEAALSMVAFSVKRHDTRLTYTGPGQGFRGQFVRLEATLADHASLAGLAGRTVRFDLGPDSAFAQTDRAGHAEVGVTLDAVPGAYTAMVSFDGDAIHEPATDARAFDVRWEYRFDDARGAGVVFLNPSTNEFHVVTDDGETGIQGATMMPGIGRVLIVSDGVSILGTFDLGSGVFAASVTVRQTPSVLFSPG